VYLLFCLLSDSEVGSPSKNDFVKYPTVIRDYFLGKCRSNASLNLNSEMLLVPSINLVSIVEEMPQVLSVKGMMILLCAIGVP
jgi:hypothetical protein